MNENEFDLDICCHGVSWDKQQGYDDDVRVTKYYRIDTLMFRASPEMLHEWCVCHAVKDIDDFETTEEYNRYIDDREEAQREWKRKVCQMLGWELNHVRITKHMSEIFAASRIKRVKVEDYGG